MSLRVQGLVNEARSYDENQLAKISGQVPDVSELIPGRDGTAVTLRSLLSEVGMQAEAKYITLSAEDGKFSASVPVDAVLDALVLYQLNGEQLPAKKGGPFRFLVPNPEACTTAEIDNCVNVKYLESIELSAEKGVDKRPTSEKQHRELHERES